jgi:hypothetical protein
MRDGKYIYAAPSRGPPALGRSPKDPDDLSGGSPSFTVRVGVTHHHDDVTMSASIVRRRTSSSIVRRIGRYRQRVYHWLDIFVE